MFSINEPLSLEKRSNHDHKIIIAWITKTLVTFLCHEITLKYLKSRDSNFYWFYIQEWFNGFIYIDKAKGKSSNTVFIACICFRLKSFCFIKLLNNSRAYITSTKMLFTLYLLTYNVLTCRALLK